MKFNIRNNTLKIIILIVFISLLGLYIVNRVEAINNKENKEMQMELSKLKSKSLEDDLVIKKLQSELDTYRLFGNDNSENDISKDSMVGVWQDSPSIGDNYTNMYHFYNNNTFEFKYAYHSESRNYSISGKWQIINNFLYLKITNKIVLTGGKFMPSELEKDSYDLVNYTHTNVEIKPNQTIIYPMGELKSSTVEYPTNISIGGITYWHLSHDPTDYND